MNNSPDCFIACDNRHRASSDSAPTVAMFSAIAARYDRCNHLFSLGIDHYWRKRLARALALQAGHTALDICCGTGDMAFALLKHTPVRQVWGIDCSQTMIQLAQEKRMRRIDRQPSADNALRLRVEDAAELTFEDAQFDGVSCAFGLRNIPNRPAVLKQIHRVLVGGGRVGVCEFSLPAHPVQRALYRFYLSRVMPMAGRVVLGSTEPLRYLARSIDHWHNTVHLADEFIQAGFTDVRSIALSKGMVTLTIAHKPR